MLRLKSLDFGQAALHCDAFDVQLIRDRILVGADMSLSGGLVGVQPHVGIGDVTLQASPLVSSNSFSEGVIVDRQTEP